MPLPADLAPKAPGQLIRSDDWNRLVNGVNAIETALETRIGTLETTVESLTVRVDGMETDIVALREALEPLIRDTYRVTLRTTKVNFAMGEIAELTAEIRNLRGDVPEPVDGERPWVDFVATWGQLKAVPGFASRAGVADRTISVQTDAQGVARVRLTAEIVADMTEDTEQEFRAVVDRVVGAQGRTISEVVLAANTPGDEPVMQAYQALTLSYDAASNVAVRNYVDTYFAGHSEQLAGRLSPALVNQRRERWRDHHVTVMAFGKADADPRTPDPSRGSNAIQVTFRDWLGPWILLDYFPRFEGLVPAVVDRLRPAVTLDYRGSLDRMKEVVRERVQPLGALGKAREYEVVRNALDVLDVPDRAFLPDLRQSVKSAVTLQQTVLQSQHGVVGGGFEDAAFEAFANTAAKADSQVVDVEARVRDLGVQVDAAQAQVEQQVSGVQATIRSLDGRLEATLAEGGQFRQVQQQLAVVNDQVQALRMLGDPSNVNESLQLIGAFDARISMLERR
jgi:hypothetical protein